MDGYVAWPQREHAFSPPGAVVRNFNLPHNWRQVWPAQVKHLGVCNFTVEQLRALIAAFPEDKPTVNQGTPNSI